MTTLTPGEFFIFDRNQKCVQYAEDPGICLFHPRGENREDPLIVKKVITRIYISFTMRKAVFRKYE